MTEDDFDDIVQSYPYPIAGIFSRLGTVECLDAGDRRLSCIFDTAETITRFTSAIVLCLCRDFAEEHEDTPPGAWSADLERVLRRPSWGHWLQLTREGLKWLTEVNPGDPLVQELKQFFFERPPRESRAAEALGRLLTARNDFEHGRTQAHSAADFRGLCGRTYPDLVLVMEKLRFLAAYQLHFVHQIEVSKRRRQAPDFRHRLVRIRAGGGEFRASQRSYGAALESHALIFRRGDNDGYLDLDPLLVYEQNSGAAPDLFFFNGMRSPERMEYVACKHGGGFDSENSGRVEDLAEEMRNLLRVLGAGEADDGR